jgi:hypothetical protein
LRRAPERHIARSMTQYEPEWLMFAGDATWGVICGALFAGLAAFAFWRDRKRHKRTHADQVGCMPWMTLSIVLMFAAVASLLFAAKS